LNTQELISGMNDFGKDIEGNLAILNKNPFFKNRGTNQERDMKAANDSDEFHLFRNKPSWKNQMMFNIKFGDSVSVNFGGWAVFQKYLKQGMSEDEALMMAARVANRTQQSSTLSEQTAWQRGNAVAKFFTMFLSNPNQQLRRYRSAVRGLKTGRMEPEKAAKMIVIYRFIIPMLIQLISDLGWKSDRQLRAAIVGPYNGLLIFGDKFLWGLSLITDKRAKKEPGGDIPHLEGISRDVAKALTSIDWNDIESADVWEAFQGVLGLMGKLPGLPTSGIPLSELSEMGEGGYELLIEKNIMKGVAGLLGVGEGTRKDFGESSGGRPKVQL